MIERLPDELLTEIIGYAGLDNTHRPSAQNIKRFAPVSRKFANCTQEILYQDIDLVVRNKSTIDTPKTAHKITCLFQTLLKCPGLRSKVRSLCLVDCRKRGKSPSAWIGLGEHVRSLALPVEVKYIWLDEAQRRSSEAMLVGLLSVVTNLRGLHLTNAGNLSLLSRFWGVPSPPILRLLETLKIEPLIEAVRNDYSPVSHFTGVHGQKNTSLFYHPAIRNLAIMNIHNGYVNDDRLGELQGVSRVTNLVIHGWIQDMYLASFLKRFKGLRRFVFIEIPLPILYFNLAIGLREH
ncbi:uncharacterized protein BDZ99DRAFT_523818 [Mytilinidion resinicola]|uniref:F-box domain-containing protein n=1 Tax=Mytilinidion resinicola TaxID=574789 RepID=A0A6A6YET3_9PEZI|nr:uncharacterized protein BDZ99DRAFT_523818 [Mytilinidion resinicola]KAF2806367.1 hypothetical protein BDZ99DRAFT_523818 [Mytilinidion resinicola]